MSYTADPRGACFAARTQPCLRGQRSAIALMGFGFVVETVRPVFLQDGGSNLPRIRVAARESRWGLGILFACFWGPGRRPDFRRGKFRQVRQESGPRPSYPRDIGHRSAWALNVAIAVIALIFAMRFCVAGPVGECPTAI